MPQFVDPTSAFIHRSPICISPKSELSFLPFDPVDVTSDPVDVTSDPVDVTPDPVDVTSDPVDVTSDPVDVTSDPVDVTSDPVDVTSDPVDVTSDPDFFTFCLIVVHHPRLNGLAPRKKSPPSSPNPFVVTVLAVLSLND
jgi:hypothetical protein